MKLNHISVNDSWLTYPVEFFEVAKFERFDSLSIKTAEDVRHGFLKDEIHCAIFPVFDCIDRKTLDEFRIALGVKKDTNSQQTNVLLKAETGDEIGKLFHRNFEKKLPPGFSIEREYLLSKLIETTDFVRHFSNEQKLRFIQYRHDNQGSNYGSVVKGGFHYDGGGPDDYTGILNLNGETTILTDIFIDKNISGPYIGTWIGGLNEESITFEAPKGSLILMRSGFVHGILNNSNKDLISYRGSVIPDPLL